MSELNHEGSAARFDDELRHARAVSPALMAHVVPSELVRTDTRAAAPRAEHLRRLIAAEAWTEAALALIEALPAKWTLRRLLFDDGEWWCSLSRVPALPDWLDDSAVEGRHESLPIALLLAFTTAHHAEAESPAVSVPQFRPSQGVAAYCDDFA